MKNHRRKNRKTVKPRVNRKGRLNLEGLKFPAQVARLAQDGEWNHIGREEQHKLIRNMALESGIRFHTPATVGGEEPFRLFGPHPDFYRAAKWSSRAVAIYAILRSCDPQRPLNLTDLRLMHPWLGGERAIQKAFAELRRQGYAQLMFLRRDRQLLGTYCMSFDKPIPGEWRLRKGFCWHICEDGREGELRCPTKELLDPTEWVGHDFFKTLGRLTGNQPDHQFEQVDMGLLDDGATQGEFTGEVVWVRAQTRVEQAEQVVEDQSSEPLASFCVATHEDAVVIGNLNTIPKPLTGLSNQSLENQTPEGDAVAPDAEIPESEQPRYEIGNPQLHWVNPGRRVNLPQANAVFAVPALPPTLALELAELQFQDLENSDEEIRTDYEEMLHSRLFPLMTEPPTVDGMSGWCLSWCRQSATGLAMSLLAGHQTWTASLARRFVKRIQRGYITLPQIQTALLNSNGHTAATAGSLEQLLEYKRDADGKLTDGWQNYMTRLEGGQKNIYRRSVARRLREMVADVTDNGEPAGQVRSRLSTLAEQVFDWVNRPLNLLNLNKHRLACDPQLVLQWAVACNRLGLNQEVVDWWHRRHDYAGDTDRTNGEWFRGSLQGCDHTTLLFWQLFDAELESMFGRYPWWERRAKLELLNRRAEAHGLQLRAVFDDPPAEELRTLWRRLDPVMNQLLVPGQIITPEQRRPEPLLIDRAFQTGFQVGTWEVQTHDTTPSLPGILPQDLSHLGWGTAPGYKSPSAEPVSQPVGRGIADLFDNLMAVGAGDADDESY